MPIHDLSLSQEPIFNETYAQVGAIGLVIELTIIENSLAVDVSASTVKKLIFQSPSGTILDRDAIFSTNGVDGKIRYVTILNDLDVSGTWFVQVYLEMGNFKGRSSIVSFEVNKNLV